MKKLLSIILIAVFSVSTVVGVTAAVKNNTNDITFASSDIYEVIEFVEPDKTVYSLSEDVYSFNIDTDENGEEVFQQQVDFDGTGMSMTVRNTQTGKIEKHEYSYEYFNYEGEELKCEYGLHFKFDPPLNTILTEGEYTAKVLLVTEDSQPVYHDMKFTLVDETKKETQAKAEIPTQTKSEDDVKAETKSTADKLNNNTDTDNQEIVDKTVLPTLRTVWYNENCPKGCTITINSQEGNTLNFTITSSKENYSQIATSDITVTLDTEYDGTLVRGYADFEYVDSFKNSGTGSISVSENVIILVINEEYNSGRGWGISHTTGKYL